MKMRTLFAAILGVLLVSSLSLSQETQLQELETKLQELQEELLAKDPLTPRSSSESELVTEIVTTEHFPVEELRQLISSIFRIRTIYSDRRSNRLIIQTAKEQMNDVLALIKKLDVPDSDLARIQAIQNIVHRIYMLEIPSKDGNMKPFSMILQTSLQSSSIELLDAAKGKDLQISEFRLSDERQGEQGVEILLQGKAGSNESIKRMIDSIPESRIKELKWDDYEAFTNDIAAAQYTQLPEQVQKHIRKFLGEDIQTVGYWFGSSSVPGQFEAPFGLLTLNLKLDTESDRTSDLRIEVKVYELHEDIKLYPWHEDVSPLSTRLERKRGNEILSNTINAKMGKPIIIGYNRESYGTRKMGAMVILLETDTAQLDTFETKAP